MAQQTRAAVVAQSVPNTLGIAGLGPRVRPGDFTIGTISTGGIPPYFYISKKRGGVLEVLLNSARTIYVFIMSATTGAGVSGQASSMQIWASKNGGAGAAITPTVTDLGSSLGAGWYTLALTGAHLNTLGEMALHILTSLGVPNDDVLLNVIGVDKTDAVRMGLSALPNDAAGAVSGGLPVLDANGDVQANVARWLNAVPAALSTNGYIQAMLMRWLTDNTGGTPDALSSNLVPAVVDGTIVVANVNVVEWMGATPANLDGSGNVPATIEAVGNASAVAAAVLDAARSGHVTLGTIGEGIALATSLLQGNFYIDEVTTTSNGPTSQRIRCWLSASAMSGVTPGGSGQGEFATFLVTTTYSAPGAISTHKVTQQ